MATRLERVENTLAYLRERGSASVSELAERFQVSEVTIRRDLEHLARRNQVRLFRGGAVYTGTESAGAARTSTNYRFGNAAEKRVEEKQRIARYAATLIEPGNVVFLDAGSTTEHLARELTLAADLTVVCYSASALYPLLANSDHTIIMLGGVYHRDPDVFESDEAQGLLRRTRITKAFISANGIDPDLGVTCSNSFEVGIKRGAIQSSLERYLLVDSSKFRTIESAYFADVSEFTAVITDSTLPQELAETFEARGVSIHRV